MYEKQMIEERLKSVWPDWKLVERIGGGAYGSVYKISRTSHGSADVEFAALKVISIPLEEDSMSSISMGGAKPEFYRSMAEKLVNEALVMSDMQGHPNVVRYYDHTILEYESQDRWDILIRMELLTPFMKYLYDEGFQRQDLIKLGIDICRALELCRKKEIIHRDIKPDNIFISDDGNFKLGDFGVAANADKTLGGLSKKGTYSYMAPEVYKGEPYGPTVDVYSLGIVLYRLLNNLKEPFLTDDKDIKQYEIALDRRMKGEELPLPVSDSGELARIVLKATSYSPYDRYSSPTEMKEDLEKLVNVNDKVLLFPPKVMGPGPSISTKNPPSSPSVNRISKHCSKCGSRSEFPADAHPEFCPKCGASYSPSPSMKKVTMLCSKCGVRHEYPSDVQPEFCPNCGAAFSGKKDDKPDEGHPKDGKKAKLPLMIGGAAVGVVMIIAALFFLLRPSAELIEITAETTSLTDGEVCELDYKAEPAFSKADIVWSTSDEDIATIDSKGVLTALTAGHVVVTAETGDGVSDTYELDIFSDCVTEYQGVNYAQVYDFNYYIAANPDVRKDFKDDPDGALQYYVEHGMAAGQRAISGFDPVGYAKAYADIRSAYNYDIYGITRHYLEIGYSEGRIGIGTSQMNDYITEYNGVDYSAVYDYNYYVDQYPQVFSACGINDQKTLEYFVTKGMVDGCQGSSEFNPISYANEYPEARERCNADEDNAESLLAYYQEAGGFDYSSYYYDYMEIGKNAGCHGTGCNNMIDFTIGVDGKDYSSEYDYNDYVSEYSDIFNLFGVDDNAVLCHYVLYGKEEGRIGKK